MLIGLQMLSSKDQFVQKWSADVMHFVLECNALSCIRQKYLEPRFCERPNTFKFCELMSTLKL